MQAIDVDLQHMESALVEQNARLALEVADDAYVLETGRIRLSGKAREIANNPQVLAAYLGG
jgi:branched-chain amino acid transport system ATP-binding protein